MDAQNQMVLLMSHLLDNNKLICDTSELLQARIFKDKNEIYNFIQNDVDNFCLLKKMDNTTYLCIIPVSFKSKHKFLHIYIFFLNLSL